MMDEHPVRVQWDPKRDLRFTPLPRRSIQIGLRGEAPDRYLTSWIQGIEDVTPLAREIEGCVAEARETDAVVRLPVRTPVSASGVASQSRRSFRSDPGSAPAQRGRIADVSVRRAPARDAPSGPSRTVRTSPQLGRQKSAKSGTNRHSPRIPAFPIWEQEAGSSNLPTPTTLSWFAPDLRPQRHDLSSPNREFGRGARPAVLRLPSAAAPAGLRFSLTSRSLGRSFNGGVATVGACTRSTN